MRLLAVETTGDACSCALLDGDLLHARFQIAPRRHAELVLSMVEDVLAESGYGLPDLEALAFGRGPGSFTGVRIAAGVAQGLAFGADLPVVPVSSLQALAQGAWREGAERRVLAAFDARMGEVYWGAYEVDAAGLMAVHTPELLAPPDAVPLPGGGGWLGAGQGWSAHAGSLRARLRNMLAGVDAGRLPSAVDVAALAVAMHARGESVAAEEALPLYLRNQVARKRGQ